MGLPYFPLYPSDFEAKTSHLSLEEDGAYNRLMRLMWMAPGCGLPDDDIWIMRRMRVDPDTFNRVVSPIIDEFCKRSGGKVFSPRLREEWEKADVTYKKRSAAGKKGGRPQVIENKQNHLKPGLSQPKAGPKQPEPEPEPLKRDTNVSPKRGSRLPVDFCPDMSFAKSLGLSQSQAENEAVKFKEWWPAQPGQKGVKVDWGLTWKTWCRKAAERLQKNRNHNNGIGGAFTDLLSEMEQANGVRRIEGHTGSDQNVYFPALAYGERKPD